jgi:hypothetical protein
MAKKKINKDVLYNFTKFNQYQLMAKYYFDMGIDTEIKFIEFVKDRDEISTAIKTNVRNCIKDLEKNWSGIAGVPNIFK